MNLRHTINVDIETIKDLKKYLGLLLNHYNKFLNMQKHAAEQDSKSVF